MSYSSNEATIGKNDSNISVDQVVDARKTEIEAFEKSTQALIENKECDITDVDLNAVNAATYCYATNNTASTTTTDDGKSALGETCSANSDCRDLISINHTSIVHTCNGHGLWGVPVF